MLADRMMTWDLALKLRGAGLRWDPLPGDRFRLIASGDEGEVFTVSDMTIERHEYDTGVVLGFNGTTEWALDSVALEDALWHPSEGQLRELLGGTFRALERDVSGADDGREDRPGDSGADDAGPNRGRVTAYRVRLVVAGRRHDVRGADPSEAYARGVLYLMTGE